MSDAAYCPSCCNVVRDFLAGGTRGARPRARCPRCNALERHRFLSLLLDGLAVQMHAEARVLDVAPSRFVTGRVRELAPRQHVRIDLDPDADSRTVECTASLTQLPFADATFDLVVCYHVLEHVPDDRSAMSELSRVLAPSGIALVQFPLRPQATTDEDPDAPAEERARRFGQSDHVRWYGQDVTGRLVAAGLRGYRVQPRDVVGPRVVDWCGLNPDETVWVLRRSDDAPADIEDRGRLGLPGTVGWAHALDSMQADLAGARAAMEQRDVVIAAMRAKIRAAQERTDELEGLVQLWEARYQRIREHPVVDFAARVSRPIRARRGA